MIVPKEGLTCPRPSLREAFSLAIGTYDPKDLPNNAAPLAAITNFRDRANSQDALESFLASDEAIVVVRGGTACGKTALVAHVLGRRAHGRVPISLDCQAVDSVWPLLEQYLLGVGCSCALDVLSGDSTCSFREITADFGRLVASLAARTIVCLDHFECLLDPAGVVMDQEVVAFLVVLLGNPSSKVIITSRSNPALGFVPYGIAVAPEQPPVGRFPRSAPHTENLLDDYVDRAALGITSYPQSLLDAIDRFPYLATLAGKLIAGAGAGCMEDAEVLRLIKSYLYDELIMRIVTEKARPALDLAALLRIPSPRLLFHGIVGESATQAAENTGILYTVPDRYRDDLLASTPVLRESWERLDDGEAGDILGLSPKELHRSVAKWYSMLTKATEGDPRWIREAHYHTMASGDRDGISKFGRMYRGELFWAARTWFHKLREYKAALEALSAAENLGLRTYDSRMLTASCLVRVGNREDGEARYRELIRDYPNQIGVKTSLIDSLLRIGDYNGALALLEEFCLRMDGPSEWVTGQYGRAYMGLHRYEAAEEAFELQMRKYSTAPAVVYIRLAQARLRLGKRDEARSATEHGRALHPEDLALRTQVCADMIRQGTEEALADAYRQVCDLLEESPRNGYVLQLYMRLCEMKGELSLAIDRLDQIGWEVQPARSREHLQLTAAILQRNWQRALAMLADMNTQVSEAYTEAMRCKTYLAWAASESDQNTRQRVAAKAILVPVPQVLYSNVPIMAMYAKLANIAQDEEVFRECLEEIRKVNTQAADGLEGTLLSGADWDELDAWDGLDEAPV